jgi:hypothetical protein
VLAGDSGEILPQLLSSISTPALFWLDAHDSAGITTRGGGATPIRREIQAILDHWVNGHVILVDDAGAFGVDSAYPSIDDVRSMLLSKKPGLRAEIESNIIRIYATR